MDDVVLTRAQSRAVDALAIEDYGIPGMVLMENAGRGVAEVLLQIDPALREASAPVVAILCGKGNNAGDGFVIARHLRIHGCLPKVLLLAPPEQLRGDALQNYHILRRTDVRVVNFWAVPELTTALDIEACRAAWVLDAMLGTGASGPLREPIRTAAEWLNNHRGRCLAIDVPSGLDCDSGEPAQGAVRADHTCTFVAPKSGFSAPTAAAHLGQLHVVSIGIPEQLIAEVRGHRS